MLGDRHVRPGRGLVVALWAALVAGCNTASVANPAIQGQAHFENYCAPCHGPDGHGNPEIAAPSIAGLPQWYVERQLVKYREGIRGAHFDDIEGYRMRPMSLALPSQRAITEVSAYVSTELTAFEPVASLGGDATRGKQLYATCAACHGPEAAGNEQLGAPPLTTNYDWYLVNQLKKFKHGARAYDELDTWGRTMVPMAQGLADEQAMIDVVAYIQTLR